MLYKDLKTAYMQAMKDKNKIAKDLLSIVIGKIDNEGKLKTGANEEQVVLQALQAFHKNLSKTKADFENKTDEKSLAFLQKTKEEIAFLETLLPQKMSDEKLAEVITEQKAKGLQSKEILAFLKANYQGLYDGKKAFELTKE